MVEVLTPSTYAQLDDVRDLMRAFVAWHRRRHQEDLALIDAYFDAAAFEAELASLPGKYVPPRGRLLLATVDGRPAGCVALREIDAEACEMKRMFVYEDLHGRGVGRALGLAVLEAARAAGYRRMLLDTSIRQIEAQTLYRRLGFRDIEPYYELPQELRDWLVFMELPLRP
ncbi:MAG TPA: GNAT family N-acetyltransferase [Longimicrobiales bacterium]|nr:GNAT family N-acetyltransferase [Longimicrobiales bacterium]